MRILLTNPNYKHTWIMAAHLHDLGHQIYCVSESKFNFLSFSRFIKKIIICQHPSQEQYEQLCEKHHIEIIIPIGFKESLLLSSFIESSLIQSLLPISSHSKILFTSNKEKITEFIRNLNIPIPEVFKIDDFNSCLNNNIAINHFLKPSREGLIKKYFHIIDKNSFDNALLFYSNIGYSKSDLILQKFINGVGIGYFAICEDGQPIVEYAHERIREWPTTGGYSTACRRHYDLGLFKMSRKIIKALNWRGPIMIEFRKSSTNGKYYFIEVNPKFWGSLELGMQSGIDIAAATLSIIDNGQKFNNQSNAINTSLSIAWPFDGDLFHYFLKPKVFFDLLKSKTYISTGLLRDPAYGIIKLFYLPVRILKELFK